MVTYNKERTAYMRADRYENYWYLLPRGRKKAPRLGREGPLLLMGISDYLVEYITEEDREVLLDAEDADVFHMVLREVEHVLIDRYQAERDRKWKVAKEIIDSYRGD